MTSCKKHPRYRGVRRPRSNCLDCWKIYANDLERRHDRLDKLRKEAYDIVDKQYQQIRAEHIFGDEPHCTLCGCFGPIEDDKPCVPRKDLMKRIRELEGLHDAATELLEVANLRGDSSLPHPADDTKLWTARMQTAWDELREALSNVEKGRS